MITGATLDHVAVAAERWEDAWPRYAHELGGRWVSGGEAPGFAAHQLRFANGGKLEIIRPHAVEQNDFLRRFIDRNGLGPHHLTFKVPDIAAALDEAERSGYRPVNVNLDDPDWKEAFLHPKEAPGVVVQLAESAGDWSSAPPLGFPPAAHDAAATLDRVVHAVADLDDGLALFATLLGGEEVDRGDGWVELRWATPIRVRLVTSETAWVGERHGRVHHVAFTCPWLEGEARTVEPDDNLGTRLVMFPS
ncbi:MAG TPA: VOC family protein [Acidimicrobiales bacterium]|nr:VOC family protein [Acidimicrobiales bacterium]